MRQYMTNLMAAAYLYTPKYNLQFMSESENLRTTDLSLKL